LQDGRASPFLILQLIVKVEIYAALFFFVLSNLRRLASLKVNLLSDCRIVAILLFGASKSANTV
jgi:hypothetical protein